MAGKRDSHGVSLTDQQIRYVELVARNVAPEEACRQAGYQYPPQAVWRLKKDPRIQTAITRETVALLQSEGVPAARHRIVTLIRSDETPPAVQLKASTWLMETMGIGPKNHSENNDLGSKALEDMTLGELEQIANAAKSRMEGIPAIEGETLEHQPQQGTRQDKHQTGGEGGAENLDELMS